MHFSLEMFIKAMLTKMWRKKQNTTIKVEASNIMKSGPFFKILWGWRSSTKIEMHSCISPQRWFVVWWAWRCTVISLRSLPLSIFSRSLSAKLCKREGDQNQPVYGASGVKTPTVISLSQTWDSKQWYSYHEYAVLIDSHTQPPPIRFLYQFPWSTF